ncbi:MAG: thymidylate synthase (FAD) [Firmicutes bacterium HGW-Firmicutes-12]|nr:MAG: thymidylate synthase (FAD) [Firmicutes bacterium HGW-Firmicutes-12]
MGRKILYVRILRHSPEPEEIVAFGAKLCYSPIDVDKLDTGVQSKEQGDFISKLMELGHMSPLEHASFTFAIEGVSRSLLAQITRHRIASFSVQSQRYVSEHSAKSEGQVFDFILPPRIEALGEEYIEIYQKQMEKIQEWYDFWLEKLEETGGQGKEDARFILPNAAETKLILTMNARELLHFFNLRCCNRAQWEIRKLAEQMLLEVKKIAPNIFKNGGPECLSGPCPEGKMTCGKGAEVRSKYAQFN